VNEQDMRDNVNGHITGGEKIDIDIKQIGDRKYEVYVNDKFVDYIYNSPNYYTKNISSLLMADAENLARKNNLIPKKFAMRIQFIGNINHKDNK
jgi:hypothetical protein